MNYNKKLIISSAGSRKSSLWPKQEIYWSELLEKLKTPVRGTESLEEYLKYPKSKQDELKDVGGFVGGELKDNKRKATNVIGRDIISLDMDNIEAGKTQEVLKKVEALGCAYVVYSTRKHAAYKPRLRALFPTDRTMSADEYEPVARKLAGIIGIELCDPTTFEANRLMYWPSCSSDSEYIYCFKDAPFVSADGILNMYGDWKDISQWPQVPGIDLHEKRLLAKQEDPTEKTGIIGAFCKTFNVIDAMDTFLKGVYEPCDITGRFTFIGGSTTGGAIIYEDGKFIYSHHATDPISGKLCNSFDLVRIHLFESLDEDAKEGTPANKLPSFVEMSKLALGQEEVSNILNKERYEKAVNIFAVESNSTTLPQSTTETVEDLQWMNTLASNKNGNIEKTINNIVIILENDPSLKGKMAMDEFANRGLVLGPLPWNPEKEQRMWSDHDDSEITRYLETTFNITGKDKIEHALRIVSFRNKINEVKSYLENLKWDGKKRLDYLLSWYLGAEDNIYTRAVMRKSLCAAVARAMTAGVKYDYMPIFTGPQGIGKSTFLAILGKKWFSDSLQTFEGKDAAEMIQGTWINEIGELTGMSKTETNLVKQFLSKKEDIYREAYGRRTGKYPRRCVFFGTSNDDEFLKDATGNRRFWPVEVGLYPPSKSIFNDLEDEVDQIWGEAYAYWQIGEPLYLSGEVEAIAKEEQERHRESNVKEGLIAEFLKKKVTEDWENKDLAARRMFWSGNFPLTGVELVERDKVCALEIWCECFGGDPKYIKKADSIEINNILCRMKGWKRNKATRRYGYCGTQRGFDKAENSSKNNLKIV